MYGTTYDDLAGTPPRIAWQMIRELRARPPGLAGTDENRRHTFTAALEQSEQLMTAAAGAGVATRPILVFYGLSQAGRALCAAAESDPTGWEPRGHGIRVPGHDRAEARRVADVRVRDDQDGSFVRVAKVLGSETLPAATRVGELWPLICSPRRFPLEGSGDARPLEIRAPAPTRIPVNGPVRARISGLPDDLGTRFAPDEDPSRPAPGRYEEERERVRSYLGRYPAMADAFFTTPEGNPTGITTTSPGRAEVDLLWPGTEGESFESFLSTHTTGYQTRDLFFPSLHRTGKAMHPMVAWWGVLVALSSLCRYEPREWDAMTALNSSADAVAIQHLLTEALTALPETIHRAITTAAPA